MPLLVNRRSASAPKVSKKTLATKLVRKFDDPALKADLYQCVADLAFLGWAYGWETNDELIVGNVQLSKLPLAYRAVAIHSFQVQELSVA